MEGRKKLSELEVDPRWGIRVSPTMVAQLELAEDEFICGSTFDKRSDGSFLRMYPTVRRVAEKYGIPPVLLEEIAVRNKWNDQRIRFQTKVKEELRSMQAKAKAVSTEESIEIIDAYLLKFKQAVEDGDVRNDNIADLDKALRLKEFMKGNADSRSEKRVTLSLEEIQARHRSAIESGKEQSLAVIGVLEDLSDDDVSVADVEEAEEQPVEPDE